MDHPAAPAAPRRAPLPSGGGAGPARAAPPRKVGGRGVGGLCAGLASSLWFGGRAAADPSASPGDTIEVRDQGADPRDKAATVSVVPVDERLGVGADLGQAVARVPGVRVSQLGALGDLSAVSVRGSSLRQVVIALDGVPLNPDGAAVVNLSELPLQAFSAVEVWRGAAPAAFGVAPIGGVVNLVTGDRPDGDQVGLMGGSLRTGRLSASSARSGALAGQPADLLVFAQGFGTAGDFWAFSDHNTPYNLLDDAVLRRANNDKRQGSASVRGRWGRARARIGLQDHLLLREEGVPGAISTPSSAARLDTARNLSVLSAEGAGGGKIWTARAWRLDRRERLADPQNELGVGVGGAEVSTSSLGALAHGTLHLRPRLRPALTLSLRQDGAQFGETDAALEARRRFALSGAAELELGAPADPWAARVGAQVDRLWSPRPDNSAGAALDGEADPQVAVSPRVGLVLRPWAPLRLAANAQRAFRAPDLTELYGDRGAAVGNPRLRPEQGLHWDVGGRLALPPRSGVQAELEVLHFWSAVKDQIIYIQNSQNTAVPVNFGETWTQGLELGAGGAWGIGGPVGAAPLTLELRTAATWTTSRNLSPQPELANKQLPRVPASQLYQESGLQLGARWRLGHSYTRVAGNHWDATNFYLSPPRSLHGAFLRWSAPLGAAEARGHRLALEASGQNLGDQIVQVVPRNRLDPEDDALRVEPVVDFGGFPIAGRAVFVGLRWERAPPAP